MCRRYTLSKLQDILRPFSLLLELPPILAPRFNMAPTQPILAITNEHPDRLEHLYWGGFVPSWAKDISVGSRMIKARAETLAEKPTFRRPLIGGGVLFPPTGFTNGARTPTAPGCQC